MTIQVPRNGTRGTKQPQMPKSLMAGLNRLFNGIYRRLGSRMQISGRPLLLLTTIGAKSGQQRETVLGYWNEEGAADGSVLVAATAGGSAVQPAWLHNLARNPDKVWVERAGERLHVTPEALTGTEREAAWQKITDASAQYRSYNDKTDREIPVVRLRPVAGRA